MEQTFTVPSKDVIYRSTQIMFNVQGEGVNKELWATVIVEHNDEGRITRRDLSINVNQLFVEQGVTPTQITIFKAILKGIIAKAWEKTSAELTGDLF